MILNFNIFFKENSNDHSLELSEQNLSVPILSCNSSLAFSAPAFPESFL